MKIIKIACLLIRFISDPLFRMLVREIFYAGAQQHKLVVLFRAIFYGLPAVACEIMDYRHIIWITSIK